MIRFMILNGEALVSTQPGLGAHQERSSTAGCSNSEESVPGPSCRPLASRARPQQGLGDAELGNIDLFSILHLWFTKELNLYSGPAEGHGTGGADGRTQSDTAVCSTC